MGNVTSFNKVQFLEVNRYQLGGVTLVYKSVKRDTGEMTETAINFSGDGYEPESGSQTDVFNVWKNVVATFWTAKAVEASLKGDNHGISCKLKSKVPASIIVRTANGKTVEWDIEASIWSKIGLVPTKKDLEELTGARDRKKKMHRSAVASFNALNFRLKFDDIVEAAAKDNASATAKDEKAA